MIKLNQSAHTLELKDLKINNQIVFDYSDQKVAKGDYVSKNRMVPNP